MKGLTLRNILLYIVCGFMIIACGSNESAASKEAKFDFSTLGNVEQFYLLKGDDNKSVIYLNIAKNKDSNSNAIAEISGKYMIDNKEYLLEAQVLDATSTITFDIKNDKDSTPTHAFEGNILADGSINANVLDKNLGAAKIAFSPMSDVLNHILLPTESMEEKYAGKDYDNSPKDYTFNALKQAIFIDNANTQGLKAINASFGGDSIDVISQGLKDSLQKDFEEQKGSSNYESIESLEVDYIDKNILVLNKYSYIYSGGAHGNYGNEMVAFNLESGEKLPNDIASLLKDENDKELKAMVIERLKKVTMLDDEDVKLSMFRIDSNGVEFYWGLYEIASYAEGIISIRFSFDELAKFVKEDSPYYYLFSKKA